MGVRGGGRGSAWSQAEPEEEVKAAGRAWRGWPEKRAGISPGKLR